MRNMAAEPSGKHGCGVHGEYQDCLQEDKIIPRHQAIQLRTSLQVLLVDGRTDLVRDCGHLLLELFGVAPREGLHAFECV